MTGPQAHAFQSHPSVMSSRIANAASPVSKRRGGGGKGGGGGGGGGGLGSITMSIVAAQRRLTKHHHEMVSCLTSDRHAAWPSLVDRMLKREDENTEEAAHCIAGCMQC